MASIRHFQTDIGAAGTNVLIREKTIRALFLWCRKGRGRREVWRTYPEH